MAFKMTNKIRIKMINKLSDLMANTSDSNEEIDSYESELHELEDEELESAFYEACCGDDESFEAEVKEMESET